jgi:hypothetical protein
VYTIDLLLGIALVIMGIVDLFSGGIGLQVTLVELIVGTSAILFALYKLQTVNSHKGKS